MVAGTERAAGWAASVQPVAVSGPGPSAGRGWAVRSDPACGGPGEGIFQDHLWLGRAAAGRSAIVMI